MLALEVRFLTGRYAATVFNDRRRAEWPPHPARIYSALVAALYDDPDHGAEEREALEWLAQAGAPDVFASDAAHRSQSDVYVPTNDASAVPSIDKYIDACTAAESNRYQTTGNAAAKAEKALAKARAALTKRSIATAAADGKGTPANAAEVLPNGRSRQPRTFPVSIPHDDVVYVQWQEAPPEATAKALDRVASRVARLGHSSSLVSMRVAPGEIEVGKRTRWIPDPNGSAIFRVASAGQLSRLDEAHARYQQVLPRVLPASFVRYGDHAAHELSASAPGTCFADEGWQIFETVSEAGGKRRRLLDVSLAQQVARALRGTLLRAIDGQWPEVLSGHSADGGPSQQPHLAFVPLADVRQARPDGDAHLHASGSILGVALVPPRGLTAENCAELFRGIGLAERAASEESEHSPPALRLLLGRYGTVHLRRLNDVHAARALQASRWTKPARRWATATAIALGRNPGDLRSRNPRVAARAVEEAEQSVAAACVNLGLPEPTTVYVHARSLLGGAPPARRFMPFPDGGSGPRRVCVHAELIFDEPVRGPVILGAGRFFGLGLCAPWDCR